MNTTARILALLTVLLGLLGGPPLWAQDRTPFATVQRLSGAVWVLRADTGERRALAVGEVVYTRDRIETEAAAEVLLRTEDGGALALRPRTTVSMEQYNAERSERARWGLRVLGGHLRAVTGWIAQYNRSGYRVDTPTATIGVRGTDHEPYVVSAELAAQLQQPAGSYDKVNRGETALASGGVEIAVPAGRVGFVPEGPRTRALGTVLLPALLERVPGFYVAGQFDAELDALGGGSTPPPTPPAPSAPAPAPGTAAVPDRCGAQAIATRWLDTLDRAVRERSAPAFLDQFLPEARITAQVVARPAGVATLTFTRDELARSTLDALAQLSDYRSRRITVRAEAVDEPAGPPCQRLRVESLVLESGRRQGQPFQLESVENFVLLRGPDGWRALEGATRPR